MGNFDYQCGKCNDDERDYFGKPAQVFAKTKDGKEICMNGEYTGYGAVVLPGGQEFYLKQFEEFWEGWIDDHRTDEETGPFVGGGILCEHCAYEQIATPMTEYTLSDFQTVKDYIEKKKAPAPVLPAPKNVVKVRKPKRDLELMACEIILANLGMASDPVEEAPKPVKVPKPKTLTKADLEVKVAELQREVDRLKPMEKRLQDLDKAYQKMQDANRINSRRLKKISEVMCGNMDYSDEDS